MQLRMKVTHQDGSSVVAEATTLDLVRWEDKTEKSIASLFENRRLGDITWLAWETLHRKNQTELEYDAWLDTVSGIELGSDDEPVPLGN